MIDVSKSALLVLHVQNDIVKPEGKFAYSGMYVQVQKANLLEKIAKVIKASRDAGVRVIYGNIVLRPGYPELNEKSQPIIWGIKEVGALVKGSWGAENAAEITPLPDDWIVYNYACDCFSYTDLDILLRANGITDLYLTGTATTFVINSTTRHGSELGYAITILEDCCRSFTQEMHDFEIKHVLPHFGTISNSSDFIATLPKK